MANEVVTFQGATGLAKMDLNMLHKAFVDAAPAIPQTAGGGDVKYLRMQKHDGIWVYGRDNVEVEPESEWAINPLSLQTGFIAWGGTAGKPLGKVMRPIVGHPPVVRSELPHVAGTWEENVGMQLLCLTGEDTGVQVEYTQNSYGGKQAFGDIYQAIRLQLSKGDMSLIVPVVVFEDRQYTNAYGPQRSPVFRIVRWMGMDAQPAAASVEDPKSEPAQEPAAPPSAPAEPARTRRFNRPAPVTDVQPPANKPAPGQTNGGGNAQPAEGNVVRRSRR